MSQRHLVPCPSCDRDVFNDACVCPFCDAPLPKHTCVAPAPAAVRGRLGRGARVVACASLIGASGCGAALYGVAIPPFDAGATDSAADTTADGVTHGAPSPALGRKDDEPK
jgi:hypothetical protein